MGLCVNLARNEGSFLAEYRVDPRGFDTLLELLRPALERNEAKAAAAGNDHCGLQVEFFANFCWFKTRGCLEEADLWRLCGLTGFQKPWCIKSALRRRSHNRMPSTCDNAKLYVT